MNLAKAVLPDSVEVSGRQYRIHTGHPYWFRFHEVYSQERRYVHEFDFLYDGERPEDGQAGVSALLGFFYEPRDIPRSEGGDGERALDYKVDSDFIYAAILQCYGVDLYDREWHWHKVRAMISGLHGTKLNEIMSYRICAPGKSKELARMKRIWELPARVTEADAVAFKAFDEQFYGA